MRSKESVFEASPWRAIAELCIPSLISIIVMMLYNMADMFFVAKSGDLRQVAAVSLAMPAFTFMMAISTMIGNGGCTLIAQALGKDDHEKVRQYSALCVYASIGAGLLLAFLCFILQRPLLNFLSAKEDTYDFTRTYLLILAAGAPMILLNHSLSSMLRGEGLIRTGLAAHMISTVSNIILDPILIIGLKMGVGGAAIATVLGNVVAIVYVAVFRARHQKACVIELRPSFAKDLKALGAILSLGLPNAISSILSGLAGTFSNRLLTGYGTEAVAAMSAAGKAVMVVTMVQMGICMGAQPLLAYCYGGKNWEKLKGIIRRLLFLTVTTGVVLTLVIWFSREWVIGLFIKDSAAAALGIRQVGYMLLMGPVIGLYYLASNFLQAAGNAPAASFSSALRQGLLLIPLLYLMEYLSGLIGLALAHTAADAASILITGVMAICYYRKIAK